MRQDLNRGVIVTNRTLVIQRITRRHAGEYVCTAVNPHGAGKSNSLDLRVKCEYFEDLSRSICL